ncbi:MAG TPA: hypothetical protein VL126_03770 [Bacteroidota bacterium]|nr:hypothetical protein [Bacteroidota bacterium]
MTQFVKSRSLFFYLVAWLFIAALFCDGANLDDLFPGFIVLHDDDDVATADQAASTGDIVLLSQVAHQSQGTCTAGQTIPFSPARYRIILDQDSPSLAAHTFQSVLKDLSLFSESPTLAFDRQLPTELLFLRFHSLLI